MRNFGFGGGISKISFRICGIFKNKNDNHDVDPYLDGAPKTKDKQNELWQKILNQWSQRYEKEAIEQWLSFYE